MTTVGVKGLKPMLIIARAMVFIGAVFDVDRLFVCRPSVRHDPVLCLNGLTCRRNSFTI